jgi:cyanobactin maturation PatA/PatG family protease
VCVAVLDGPVDFSHPCFQGADLTQVATLVDETAGVGSMSIHGTHVTSIIFGQPDSPVVGVAPRCRGLILPIFGDQQNTRLSQLDLARAIERAVEEGAHIINISGGQRAPLGQSDPILERAISLCAERGVLMVAATGNDGCDCLHVPAALPSVLAVGALGDDGKPLDASNWGEAYRSKGVLAPGQNILGAVPNGSTRRLTGSSFATPIVSGAAALLLSLQKRDGQQIDPLAVGELIVRSARPCLPHDDPRCERYLAGILDITVARMLMKQQREKPMADLDDAQALPQAIGMASTDSGSSPRGAVLPDTTVLPDTKGVTGDDPSKSIAPSLVAGPSGVPAGLISPIAQAASPAVTASSDCGCDSAMISYIFAVGSLSFDFGTEARRDSFRQLMPSFVVTRPDGTTVSAPPNPYDAIQLLDYLEANPWESIKLIWTLNLDLTPIYAIEAELAYAENVYRVLRSALRGQSLPDTDNNYVSRVSISGTLTSRTVRLFSGQLVPVVVAQPRGLYSWNENQLINVVVEAISSTAAPADANAFSDAARITLRNFIDKVYYQLRNLGQNPADRALNYATTNAFAAALGIARALDPASHGIVRRVPDQTGIYSLDTISVVKSPFCRMDSDCWDVQLTFFDPENDRRAKTVILLTVDVSDEMPVTLGPSRFFTVAN